MRYKVEFSYDGTEFSGYQIQHGLRTVQGCLEDAVSFLNGQTKTEVQASGRTDKGVHALRQVAHFDLNKDIRLDKIRRGLNSNLPKDIHVISVEEADPEFHARYNVKEKEYIYLINVGEYNPMKRNYEFQYNRKLNIDKMKEAIKLFEGTHDFTSFVSSEDERENKTRTIHKTNIKVENDIIEISFIANGFMKYQVRNMVGLLLDIGRGKKEVNDVIRILEAKDRRVSSRTIAACGLYLKEVKY